MAHKWKKYILWFAQEHVEFRQAEFNSVVKIFNLEFRTLSQNLWNPFWIVEFPDDETALKLASRSVGLRHIFELWAHGNTWPTFHEQLKNYLKTNEENLKQYLERKKSFKITVESYNKHFSHCEKIDKIESMDYLPVLGDVNLHTPDIEYWYIEFWGLDPTMVPQLPEDVLFGRLLAHGQRELIKELSLKKRKFIGNTSMDAQLSLLMANQALVNDNDLVFDPFVGTGSLLVSAAKFGGYVLGADIDYMMLHARCRPSRITQRVREKDESVRANLEQYGFAHRYLDVVVADFANPVWRYDIQFDSIITDPPYGIREATEKIETKFPIKPLPLDAENMPHYPSTSRYELQQIYLDLLSFAAQHLRVGGRLVCWLPFHRVFGMAAKNIESKVEIVSIDLPDEIWLEIFSFLSQCDRHIVGIVCKRFQEIIDSIRVIPISKLRITEKNVKEIRADIEKKNIEKRSFKYLELENIESIEDIKFILKSIGGQVDHLSIKRTAVFEILKGFVINIKSLELYFDDVLTLNIAHFNLCVFPLLEKLVFFNNALVPAASKTLLLQLLEGEKTLSLKYLKLQSLYEFEDELVKVLLRYAKNLETLHINFGGTESSYWENVWIKLEKLRNIDLTNQLSTNRLLSIFGTLPKTTPLQNIKLNGSIDDKCCLSDTLLTTIVEKWMYSIHGIELTFCSTITDHSLMELRKLSKLHKLKLFGCSEITKMGLLMGIAIEENPIMEELYLSYLSKLDDLGLRIMASRFPNVRVLNLNYLEKAVTDKSLASILHHQSRIRTLYLDDCCEITDKGLTGYINHRYTIKRLRHLEELSLKNCVNLTDRTLIESFHLPELRMLNLGGCHKITSKGLENLVKKCPLLIELELASIVMVDDNSLFVIGNGLKALRKLVITNCKNLPIIIIDHITDVFNALQDPITNTIFSSKCKLILNDN